MPRNTRTNASHQTRAQRNAEGVEHARAAERHRALGSRCEGEALQHYAEAGKELIRVKELACRHGQFKRWLAAGHFHASVDTAQDYMTVARCWPRFADAGSIRECVRLTREYERHGRGNSTAVNRQNGRFIAEDFARTVHTVNITGHFARSTREAILSNFGGGHGWCRSDAARDAAVFVHTNPVGERLWAEVQETKTYIDEVLVPQLIAFHENLLVERIIPALHEWLERASAEELPDQPQPAQVLSEPDQPLPETEQPVRVSPPRRRMTTVQNDANGVSRNVNA